MSGLACEKLLEDCKVALEMLEEPETDPARWRVKWAGSVALLRAVGHVLLYEDAANDTALKKAVDDRFRLWKDAEQDNEIYWNFITQERNSLLKHYRFGPCINEYVSLGIEADQTVDICELDGDLFRPLKGNYRQGDDARDVYQEALSWWTLQLKEITEKTE